MAEGTGGSVLQLLFKWNLHLVDWNCILGLLPFRDKIFGLSAAMKIAWNRRFQFRLSSEKTLACFWLVVPYIHYHSAFLRVKRCRSHLLNPWKSWRYLGIKLTQHFYPDQSLYLIDLRVAYLAFDQYLGHRGVFLVCICFNPFATLSNSLLTLYCCIGPLVAVVQLIFDARRRYHLSGCLGRISFVFSLFSSLRGVFIPCYHEVVLILLRFFLLESTVVSFV